MKKKNIVSIVIFVLLSNAILIFLKWYKSNKYSTDYTICQTKADREVPSIDDIEVPTVVQEQPLNDGVLIPLDPRRQEWFRIRKNIETACMREKGYSSEEYEEGYRPEE